MGSGRSRMCQWQLKARYDFKARDLQPVVNILFCKVAVIYSSVCESVDPFLPMYLIRVDISDLSVHEAAELIQSSVLVVFYYMTEWFPSRLAFIHYIPQLTFAYFLLKENAFPTLNFDFRITIAAVTGGHQEVLPPASEEGTGAPILCNWLGVGEWIGTQELLWCDRVRRSPLQWLIGIALNTVYWSV